MYILIDSVINERYYLPTAGNLVIVLIIHIILIRRKLNTFLFKNLHVVTMVTSVARQTFMILCVDLIVEYTLNCTCTCM